MSRKNATYGELSKRLDRIIADQKMEKERIGRLMADAFLTDEVACVLGEYSDTELRKIMAYAAADLGKHVARFEAEKKARRKPVADADGSQTTARPAADDVKAAAPRVLNPMPVPSVLGRNED